MKVEMFDRFVTERIKIGEGMMSRVYTWEGFAYKCFDDSYPDEWIAYEYRQENEVATSGLPIPKYYPSEFPKSIKMDLISGTSMFMRFETEDRDTVLDDFMDWFEKIHQVKDLGLYHLSKYLDRKIGEAPVADEQKARARQYILDVETDVDEEEVLCHMDYHTLNVMYEGNDIRIIDWVDAKNGKAIWDYARTYVIFYEYAAGLKNRYLKKVYASRGYSEEAFMKAVYVHAVFRAFQNNTKRIRQLLKLLDETFRIS